MKSMCRAACCSEPAKSLPEKLAFLDIPLCGRHINHILAVVAAERDDARQKAVALVEARRLVFPPEGAVLAALEGGRP